jgi:hypothetical protein
MRLHQKINARPGQERVNVVKRDAKAEVKFAKDVWRLFAALAEVGKCKVFTCGAA